MSLSRNIFSRARLQLVTMYAIIFLVMVTIADIIVGYNRTQVLRNVIHQVVDDPEIDSTIFASRQEALSDLAPQKYSLFLLLCLIVSSIAYMLANRSLKPITEVVESQRRFIANASHELRTPLSVMKAHADVVLHMKDQLIKKDMEEALSVIVSEIDHISGTIDTLLRISNDTQTRKSIPLSRMAVRHSIEKVLEVILPMSKSKAITLDFVCVRDGFIEGNNVAFEGVVMNLLKNAIIYTYSSGEIRVLLECNKNICKVVIEDTGIGIPEKDVPYIFVPFFRSEEAKRHDKTGSGLGLALAKELVEAQRGSISIISKPNKGTSVTMLFPAVA